jgi:hypothetical protein
LVCRAVRKDPIRRRTLHHAAPELLHRQAGVPLARRLLEKGRRRKVKVIGEVAKRSKVGRCEREVRQTSPLLLYQTSQLERSRREGKILVLVGAIVAFGCFVRVSSQSSSHGRQAKRTGGSTHLVRNASASLRRYTHAGTRKISARGQNSRARWRYCRVRVLRARDVRLLRVPLNSPVLNLPAMDDKLRGLGGARTWSGMHRRV